MLTEKRLGLSAAKQILYIYSKYNIPQIPALEAEEAGESEVTLKFERIDGESVTEHDAPDVFSELGRMHLACRSEENSPHEHTSGFITVCHGDVHLKNVVRTDSGIRFIDAELLHVGWNFSDFDYVDFYNFYDPAEYPWMIHNTECLGAYLDAVEIAHTPAQQDNLKREIMIHTLNKYISNGRKHGKDCSKEVRHLYELGSMPVIGL